MPNFKIDWDGIYTNIIKTDEDINIASDVYKTFAEARRGLLSYYRRQRDNTLMAVDRVRGLKESDIK